MEYSKGNHGKGTYERTGIGLAICKKIVSIYKGKIWVSSVKGEGSTVHIWLPEENLFTDTAKTNSIIVEEVVEVLDV